MQRLAQIALAFSLIRSASALAQPAVLGGTVRETPPTAATAVPQAQVKVITGSAGSAGSDARTVTTDAQGRFELPVAPTAGLVLEITKPGYEPARVTVTDVSRAGEMSVGLMPEARDVSLVRGGTDDCTDLPKPPEGVPGMREYARIAVHHDGIVSVRAAKLPFYNNPGYLYRLTERGWIPNESDYILLRAPLPVLGGFVYVITFGGDRDLCAPWSLDATHPN